MTADFVTTAETAETAGAEGSAETVGAEGARGTVGTEGARGAGGAGGTRGSAPGSVKGAFYRVAPVGDLALNKLHSVEIEGRIITVVRTEGGIFSFGGSCPHQGGPLCAGSIHGTMLPSDPDEYVYGQDGNVIRCPWHGYEFSIRTGESIAGAVRGRVPVYQVDVRDDVVYASLTRIKR
jgi:nitrite reductase (NADH) small subunit